MTTIELHEQFYQAKPALDKLIDKLGQDSHLDSLFKIAPRERLPAIEKEYPVEYSLLKKCGITHASSHPNPYPKGSYWYYFKTSWRAAAPIVLSFNKENSYDSTEWVKGFHKTDEYLNEWWGMGNGWQMLQLMKEIDYIKQ